MDLMEAGMLMGIDIFRMDLMIAGMVMRRVPAEVLYNELQYEPNDSRHGNETREFRPKCYTTKLGEVEGWVQVWYSVASRNREGIMIDDMG